MLHRLLSKTQPATAPYVPHMMKRPYAVQEDPAGEIRYTVFGYSPLFICAAVACPPLKLSSPRSLAILWCCDRPSAHCECTAIYDTRDTEQDDMAGNGSLCRGTRKARPRRERRHSHCWRRFTRSCESRWIRGGIDF